MSVSNVNGSGSVVAPQEMQTADSALKLATAAIELATALLQQQSQQAQGGMNPMAMMIMVMALMAAAGKGGAGGAQGQGDLMKALANMLGGAGGAKGQEGGAGGIGDFLKSMLETLGAGGAQGQGGGAGGAPAGGAAAPATTPKANPPATNVAPGLDGGAKGSPLGGAAPATGKATPAAAQGAYDASDRLLARNAQARELMAKGDLDAAEGVLGLRPTGQSAPAAGGGGVASGAPAGGAATPTTSGKDAVNGSGNGNTTVNNASTKQTAVQNNNKITQNNNEINIYNFNINAGKGGGSSPAYGAAPQQQAPGVKQADKAMSAPEGAAAKPAEGATPEWKKLSDARTQGDYDKFKGKSNKAIEESFTKTQGELDAAFRAKEQYGKANNTGEVKKADADIARLQPEADAHKRELARRNHITGKAGDSNATARDKELAKDIIEKGQYDKDMQPLNQGFSQPGLTTQSEKDVVKKAIENVEAKLAKAKAKPAEPAAEPAKPAAAEPAKTASTQAGSQTRAEGYDKYKGQSNDDIKKDIEQLQENRKGHSDKALNGDNRAGWKKQKDVELANADQHRIDMAEAELDHRQQLTEKFNSKGDLSSQVKAKEVTGGRYNKDVNPFAS